MAQFVLKIEKLYRIMGTAPIVEIARAYGLHLRLWYLAVFMNLSIDPIFLRSIFVVCN